MVHFKKNDCGFTIIEVIVAIIIIGIVTAVVVSRIGETDADLIAQTEVIKSHLRYAQSMAMNSSMIWGIECDGNSYSLFKYDRSTSPPTKTSPINLPGEDPGAVNLSDKGISSIETFTISFDYWGIPYTDESASNELILGDDEEQITIASGYEISITPNTGFIP